MHQELGTWSRKLEDCKPDLLELEGVGFGNLDKSCKNLRVVGEKDRGNIVVR